MGKPQRENKQVESQRSPERAIPFQLRMSQNLKAAVARAAKKEDRDQTKLINRAIRYYLANHGHECPPIED